MHHCLSFLKIPRLPTCQILFEKVYSAHNTHRTTNTLTLPVVGYFGKFVKLGGGQFGPPPNYFRGYHAESAIFVRYYQNNPKNKLTDQNSSLQHHFWKIKSQSKISDFSEIWYSGKSGIGKHIENFDKCFKISEPQVSSG